MTIVIIGLTLAAMIGFGLYHASKLKSIQITKSVIIEGSHEEVFDMVKYLNNFPKWSPFLAQDPGQKYEVKGIDGTVGAQYHWDGNKGKDLGYQEIVRIEPNRFVGMKCYIHKPFTAEPAFGYSFETTDQGIMVTQDFKLESGLIDAFFMWLLGVRDAMEKTNQQGLDLLKMAVENT